LKLLHEGESHPNIIQLIDDFDFHNHLCFVLEPMSQDLEQLIFNTRKGTEGKPLGVSPVRRFSRHLFRALRHMAKKRIIHGDLKPANILVNTKTSLLKICDFGQATTYTPAKPHLDHELGSMWYRPPEVAIGCVCDFGVDVWSIAAVLFECFTGQVMFPGKNANDMLYRFMRVKGRFPSKMIKKSAQMLEKMRVAPYFDADQRFLHIVKDKSSGKDIVRPWLVGDKPEVDLATMIPFDKFTEQEVYWARQLVDLLSQCLILNPETRMQADQAMKHKFVADKR